MDSMAPRIWPGISSPLWQVCARTEIENTVMANAVTIFRLHCFIIVMTPGCGAALVGWMRHGNCRLAASSAAIAVTQEQRRGPFYNLLPGPDKLSKIQSRQRSLLRSKIKLYSFLAG